MKFNLYSPHISYVAEDNEGNRFTEDGYYCFGRYLGNYSNEDTFKTTYTIKLYKVGYSAKNNYKHDVYLSDEEINIYFDWVSKTYNAKIEILDISEECFHVKLTIDGLKRKHLWLLNMIRMVYEYPFNLCLKEAFRIKQDNSIAELIREDSYINLIQVILSAGTLNSLTYGFFNNDQSPFNFMCSLCSDEYINSNLTIPGPVLDIYKRSKDALNDLTVASDYFGGIRKIVGEKLVKNDLAFDRNIQNITDWRDTPVFFAKFWLSEIEKDVLSRNKVYSKLYNILNQKRQ